MISGKVAVEPRSRPMMHEALVAAAEAGGATIVALEDAEAVVWADPAAVDVFSELMARAPQAGWVQLPYAGIEALAPLLDHDRIWTCGKDGQSVPVGVGCPTVKIAKVTVGGTQVGGES